MVHPRLGTGAAQDHCVIDLVEDNLLVFHPAELAPAQLLAHSGACYHDLAIVVARHT
jgi:hypothetical protein